MLEDALYSTTGHGSQKTREETETKEENGQPTKINPEIET